MRRLVRASLLVTTSLLIATACRNRVDIDRPEIGPPRELWAHARDGGIVVGFSAVDGAEGYVVYLRPSDVPEGDDSEMAAPVVVSPAVFGSGLVPAVSYYAQVAAVRDGVETERSPHVEGRIVPLPSEPLPWMNPFVTTPTYGRFGQALAAVGDVDGDGRVDLLVGAPTNNSFGANAGWATLYANRPGGLTEIRTFHGYQAESYVGRVAAGLGDVNGDGIDDLGLGLPDALFASTAISGALAYHGNGFWTPTVFEGQENWKIAAIIDGEDLGYSIAGIGDVYEGDGIADVAVGAPKAGSGRIDLYAGSPNGLDDQPVWSDVGDGLGSRLGNSIAAVGDVDGDSIPDLLVGEPAWDDDDRGRARLYFGTGDGSAFETGFASLQGTIANEHVGIAVFGVGDLDADGAREIAVAASAVGTTSTPAKVTVYHGGSREPGDEPTFVWEAEEMDVSAFLLAAAGGDVDGDGIDDLVIGDPTADVGVINTAEGAVFVFRGVAGVWPPEAVPFWTLRGDETGSVTRDQELGASLAILDVNGDRIDDIIAGSPGTGPDVDGFDPVNPTTGRVSLYYGAPTSGPRAFAGRPVSALTNQYVSPSAPRFEDDADVDHGCTWVIEPTGDQLTGYENSGCTNEVLASASIGANVSIPGPLTVRFRVTRTQTGEFSEAVSVIWVR